MTEPMPAWEARMRQQVAAVHECQRTQYDHDRVAALAELDRLRAEYRELACAVWAQPIDEVLPDHAATVAEAVKDSMLNAEIDRLRAGDFTPEEIQNFCHKIKGNAEAFAAGCVEYQYKLFGRSPTAEVIVELGRQAEWQNLAWQKACRERDEARAENTELREKLALCGDALETVDELMRLRRVRDAAKVVWLNFTTDLVTNDSHGLLGKALAECERKDGD